MTIVIFNRLARIRQDRNSQTIDINLRQEEGPGDIGANGQIAPAAAQYHIVGSIPNVNNPTLNIYNAFPTLPDMLDEAPGQSWIGQLDRYQATRQGVLLHEV